MENTNNVVAEQSTWVELKSVVIPDDARYHSPEDVAATAQSLKKNGLLQEIVVCPLGDGRYEVRGGVCRTLAAQSLGWEKIRCNIRAVASDYEKRMITFEENDKRQDASPIYQAQLLHAIKDAKKCAQRELAEEVGKDETTVSQYLSLLTFSPEVQKNFAAAKFSIKQLLELKKLPGDQAQLAAAKECEGQTNEESKKVIQKHLAAHGKSPKAKKAGDTANNSEVGFHFTWKGENLTVRGCWAAGGKGPGTLLMELQSALAEFLALHPVSKGGSTASPDTQGLAGEHPQAVPTTAKTPVVPAQTTAVAA